MAPSCYSEYDLLITPRDACSDANSCLDSQEYQSHSGQFDEFQNRFSMEINGLESCSEYRAIFKVKGG